MDHSSFTFNAPAQAHVSNQAVSPAEGPILNSKIKSKSGPRDPAEMKSIVTALAQSIVLIGQSFDEPLKPSEVPKKAPNTDDWKMLSDRLMKFVAPEFQARLEERQKLIGDRHKSGKPRSQRSEEGSLVYLNPVFLNIMNQSGILNAEEVRNEAGEVVSPARTHRLVMHEDIAIIKRPSINSIMTALVHRFNLLHPVETRYFHVDHPLIATLFTNEVIKHVADKVPKSQTEEGIRKKKEKCKKTGKVYKPPKIEDRVKMMPKIDYATGRAVEPVQMIPWILKASVISIQDDFIIPTHPRNLTKEETEAIKVVGKHFTDLTALHNAEIKERQKTAKKTAKKTEVARNIAAPSSVNFQTLNLNSNFNPMGVQNGQVTFTPPVQQPAPVQQNNFPEGFTPQPGVSFAPN